MNLVPGVTETLPPSTLLNIGSILKIAVSAFALIMCFKTKKHPAIKYPSALNSFRTPYGRAQ